MKNYRSLLQSSLIFSLLLSFAMGAVAAETSSTPEAIVIISHKDVSDSLKKSDIEQIFLGKKTRWANDAAIYFAVLTEESVYQTFLKDYINKTTIQYTNYWKKQVFTGKGRMPKSFSTSQDIIKFVAETPGAISFVLARDADVSAVKILSLHP